MTRVKKSAEQFADNDQDMDDIDFKQLLYVVLRRKWQIILLTVVVGLFATIYAYSLPNQYNASATFLLEADNGRVMNLEDVYSENNRLQDYYYTQLEIIRSTPVAKRVVKNLNLAQAPMFAVDKTLLLQNNPEYLNLPPQQLEQKIAQIQFNRALGYVRGGLSASPITKTQLVVISFSANEPEMTALIANAVAQAYIDNHMSVSLERIEKSANWLNSSLAGLKAKLEASEDKLQAYQERESLVDIGGIKGLAGQEIEALNSELSTAKQTLKQTKRIHTLVQSKNNDIDQLVLLPDVLNHPSVVPANKEKHQAEELVAELGLRYGPKHPKMIAAKADVVREQNKVNKKIKQLVSTIDSDYKKAEQNLAQINTAISLSKKKYQKLTRVENNRRELKQEVETNKNLYEAFFTKLKETAELEGFEAAVGRLVEEATIPYGPSKPNKRLIIVIAMMAAAACAVGIVLLLEALNSTIRSVDEVESKLNQNLLGIVPLVTIAKDKKQSKNEHNNNQKDKSKVNINHYQEGDDHMFAEAIRTLRTSLLLLNIEDNAKVVSISSSIPGEGKTLVSTNLAFALGQLGKTILIDTDMRRPSLAKNFNLPVKTPGLSNLIAGTHTFEQCIHFDEKNGIDIITAGDLPPNPQELLASNAFKELIKTLRDKYDRVLIDTAPIQAVSDCMIVARLADSLIFVVKADSTKQSLIKTGLKRLSLAGISIDGIVLNQVDLSKSKEYEGFNGYYDSYGYNTK